MFFVVAFLVVVFAVVVVLFYVVVSLFISLFVFQVDVCLVLCFVVVLFYFVVSLFVYLFVCLFFRWMSVSSSAFSSLQSSYGDPKGWTESYDSKLQEPADSSAFFITLSPLPSFSSSVSSCSRFPTRKNKH